MRPELCHLVIRMRTSYSMYSIVCALPTVHTVNTSDILGLWPDSTVALVLGVGVGVGVGLVVSSSCQVAALWWPTMLCAYACVCSRPFTVLRLLSKTTTVISTHHLRLRWARKFVSSCTVDNFPPSSVIQSSPPICYSTPPAHHCIVDSRC
jgi:hypothetical protein